MRDIETLLLKKQLVEANEKISQYQRQLDNFAVNQPETQEVRRTNSGSVVKVLVLVLCIVAVFFAHRHIFK